MLAVAAAAPRWLAGAVAKMAAKNAGVAKTTPAAITTVPASSPSGVATSAMSVAPTAMVSSASVHSMQRRVPVRARSRRRSGRPPP